MEKTVFFIAILILSLIPQAIAVGIPNELYVTKWQGYGIEVIQGSSVVRSWAPSGSAELAIVVDNTVKTYGYTNSGSKGAEYTLSGTYTGTQYTVNPASYGFHDGATDGTYYYSWGYFSNSLEKFDKNWNRIETMFTLTGTDRLGVTYDPTDDTFWITCWSQGRVEHYTRSGSLLGSFNTNTYSGMIALDYTDNTLWTVVYSSNAFKQYSKSGVLLQTVSVTGLNAGYIYGGEFRYLIPEPGTFVLLLLASLFCTLRFFKK